MVLKPITNGFTMLSNTIDMKKGTTIWLTGLSGAGKTTIAQEIKSREAMENIVIIDGDELRKGINSNLGFSDKDRNENVFRASHICKILNDNGIDVMACIMSPTEEQRRLAKSIIGEEKFFLTYVMCDLNTLVKRDTKGLYKKYLNGEVKNMVGFDLPYETPQNEDICVNTRANNLEECATKIIEKWLEFRFML
jgi:adenylyl-sulfate kinase